MKKQMGTITGATVVWLIFFAPAIALTHGVMWLFGSTSLFALGLAIGFTACWALVIAAETNAERQTRRELEA